MSESNPVDMTHDEREACLQLLWKVGLRTLEQDKLVGFRDKDDGSGSIMVELERGSRAWLLYAAAREVAANAGPEWVCTTVRVNTEEVDGG